MRLPWKHDPADSIERDIGCSSREAAETEARRQQDREDNPEAEWIFLRDKDRNWVARRTPREPSRRYGKGAIAGAIAEIFLP